MTVHNPYQVELRKPLTNKQRLQMFIRYKGICCLCGLKIDGIRDMWDEHLNPLWLDGDNAAENRAPAHVRCAREKTAKEAKVRAKIRRRAEAHYGAKRAKRPMPCGRRSPWKRKMDGTVVPR